MKVLAAGDLHIDNGRPHYRRDDYWGTAQRKLKSIIDIANENDARLKIAGDIFNSSRASTHVINVTMAIFQKAKYLPCVVPGQHDLIHHTNLAQTPLYNLHIAGALKIIDKVHNNVTGVGFEQPIPAEGNEFLLIHKCITEKEPPFFLEDAVSAKTMMDDYPDYKYIISGDYHPAHVHEKDGRWLINTGTMLRNKKDQTKHKPTVWLIDTDENTVTGIEIPHEPFDEVFDIEQIEYDIQHGIEIDTERLQQLMDADGEEIDLETIVYKVAHEFRAKGLNPSKTLIKETLAHVK